MNNQFIFDPRPNAPTDIFPQAARLETLDGATIAVIDNGKIHAGELLERIVDELRRSWKITGIVHIGPPSPGYGGQFADAITAAKWATAAIAAVGDCGSCSSGSLLDALIFERLGIPAVPIVTLPFFSAARALAKQHGMKDYKIETVDHPIASLNDHQITERAIDVAPRVAAALIQAR